MSQSVSDKLSQLEVAITAEQVRLQKRVSQAVIVYSIIIVAVIGYTTYLVPKLQQRTSPEALTELGKSTISQYAEQGREHLLAQLETNSEDVAKQIVTTVVEQVPHLDQYVGDLVDALSDQLVQTIQAELVPQFTAVLDANSAEIKDSYDELNDDEVAEGLVGLFMEVIEGEMDKYLNEEFVHSVGELQKQLRELGRPDVALTRKQDAQRRVLIYWSYLAKNGEVGDSVFRECIGRLQENFNFLMTDGETEPTNEDVQGSVPVKEL